MLMKYYNNLGFHYNFLIFFFQQVYVQNVNESNSQLWWTMSGNQGAKWQYANLLLGSTQPFQVVIEGVRGDEPKSDVAIDDVSFTPECSTGSKYGVTYLK
jgi:hypothetical protein